MAYIDSTFSLSMPVWTSPKLTINIWTNAVWTTKPFGLPITPFGVQRLFLVSTKTSFGQSINLKKGSKQDSPKVLVNKVTTR